MEHVKKVIMEKASGRHLEASGEHLGGRVKHLEATGGVIWEASVNVWKHLETSGVIIISIWEASGDIWRHLGGIWKHLEASGGIWKASGDI